MSALFFADDIVLLSESTEEMDKLLDVVIRWTVRWRMDISITKSKVMTMTKGVEKWEVFNTEENKWDEMEIVDCFKYLGTKIEIAPWRMFKQFNQSMIAKAKNYMYHIMSLSKSGPDTSEVARTLWYQCAIPAILYGSECNQVTEITIKELERIQAKVANFILQIPIRSSCTAGLVDVGFKSMRQQFHERKLMYHHRLLTLPSHWWARIAYKELAKMGMRSSYIREITNIRLEYNSLNLGKRLMMERIEERSSGYMMSKCLKNKKSMALMFPKQIEHHIKPWINDGSLSRILCRFRASDVGLGNRAPLSNGRQYKLCKLCSDKSQGNYLNNEVHMLTRCSSLDETRKKSGIADFIKDQKRKGVNKSDCLLYTSDAADEEDSVDLGGRRIIKK